MRWRSAEGTGSSGLQGWVGTSFGRAGEIWKGAHAISRG